MAWKHELRPASFRGVPFLVDSSDQKLGRRAVQTEYPGRDEPYPEDMGRRAWGDTIKAFVLGDDHLQQAARLAAALNSFGPGELVHPFLGTRLVQIGEVSLSHSSREGGKSTFSIEVMEAGPAQTPSINANTDIALVGACTEAQDTLNQDFLDKYSISALPQGLVDELAVHYNDALNLLAPVRASMATGVTMAEQVASIAALLEDPDALLYQLQTDVYAMFGLPPPAELDALLSSGGTTFSVQSASGSTAVEAQSMPFTYSVAPSAQQTQDVLNRLPSVESTRIVPAHLTPSRQQQVETQDQLLDLLQGTVVITSGVASAEVVYRDRNQAADVQDAFLGALEQAELQASDTLYAALQDVKVSMLDDLSRRGAGLPSVITLTPSSTLPALVQAYRLYQDATREEELVSRNGLQHPSFVPAGEPLEVIGE